METSFFIAVRVLPVELLAHQVSVEWDSALIISLMLREHSQKRVWGGEGGGTDEKLGSPPKQLEEKGGGGGWKI